MPGPELQQGALDLLILTIVSRGPLHGWAISRQIRATSNEVLEVHQGSLYPALDRLEERGWLLSEWGISPEGRRAKFYRLSAAGRKQLVAETAAWRAYAGAIELVLRST